MLNKALKKAKENKKGFTLAELLIVVAIIAVLVAISIPIFTSQLEKSRDTTTVSNLRAAYAEAQAAYLSEDATNTNVTINKDNNNAITSISVSGVVAKGVQSGYAGDVANDLPFEAPTNMGNGNGTFTVTFNYDANGAITSVNATAATTGN